ncbi:MAG: alpha-amylase family glycosyl hydrolase [Nitrospiraceae bacterium]|nr:alpha-amylase family glycosyl hydrolase [Nitrospiraceae bacterium]
MIIYNLFPLLAGRFNDWGPHLERAAGMGFNWIYINPIQRPGSSGSLYSVADYFSYNPAFTDPADKRPPKEQAMAMVKQARGLGLKIMTDLVANHCAVDSELLKTHPGWFLWSKSSRAGRPRVEHPFALENGGMVVWKDLAKFDHRGTPDPEGLFAYFKSVVEDLIETGFEGFRCDAAYQVPNRFWRRLIEETKKRHPAVLFFAETLGCPPDQTRKTAGAGFDYIFNSSKWWDFSGHWLLEQYALTREIAPSVSFPESHDTERLSEDLGGNIEGLKQHYLFSALFSAGVMIPAGFEFGFRKRLHVASTTPRDWEKTGIDLRDFITKVNAIKSEHAVFQEEAPTAALPYRNPDVLVMWKASVATEEEALLILNKDMRGKQRFCVEDIHRLLQAGAPVSDVSPEYALDYIPSPFRYDLRPGQGIVLATKRDVYQPD